MPAAGLASLALLPAPALASPHSMGCATIVYVADKNNGVVTAFDAATGTSVAWWRVDYESDVLAVAPDGSTVYVAGRRGLPGGSQRGAALRLTLDAGGTSTDSHGGSPKIAAPLGNTGPDHNGSDLSTF